MMDGDWDNNSENSITIITPPSLYLPLSGPKIFLAGSIDNGNARDWQKEAINYIQKSWKDTNITIYSPRRRTRKYKESMEYEQHAWSITMLESADFILLNLAGGGGVSPVSLLELGIYIHDPKLFLTIEDNYPKKYVVEVHYNFFAENQIYKDMKQAIDTIKNEWENRNG